LDDLEELIKPELRRFLLETESKHSQIQEVGDKQVSEAKKKALDDVQSIFDIDGPTQDDVQSISDVDWQAFIFVESEQTNQLEQRCACGPGIASTSFQVTVPFEHRKAEVERICKRAGNSITLEIDKKRFLVPGTMLVCEFKYRVYNHLKKQEPESSVTADQTIYLLANKTSPKIETQMSELYAHYHDPDGVLYLTYSAENTSG